MPTQISVDSGTVLKPAVVQDGWHLHELKIVFNSANIDGLGVYPSISATFVPWRDEGGEKVASMDMKKTVVVNDPVRVAEIYDLYILGNSQLGPAIETMTWREAQWALSIPQAEIDALPDITSPAEF